MPRKPKFRPVITRVKLNLKQREESDGEKLWILY